VRRNANPRALRHAIEVRSELVVAVANEDLRALSERRRVAQLLRGPLLGGRARYRNVDDAPGVHVDDEEGEDRTEPDVVGLQEVAGPNGVIAQKRRPALSTMGSGGSCAPHVTLDRPLRDADAEFQELTANALGSPEPVVSGHSAYQSDGRRRNARLSRLMAAAGAPLPKESESFPMPAKDGLRPHEQDGLRPCAHEPREQDDDAALVRAKRRPRLTAAATMSC